jgi:hypothetical protein
LLDLNTQPSLDLQFATGKTLNDRVSGFPLVNHQRDASSGKSAGTYVGSDGLIKTSPVNLLAYSNDFTQTWTLGTFAIDSTNLDGPFLGITGTRLDAVNQTTADQLRQIATIDSTAGTQYTASVYLKGPPGKAIKLSIVRDVGTSESSSDLNVILTDSWQRYHTTWPTASDGTNTQARISVTRADPGVGTGFASFVDVAAFQLEEGTTATDYIPTTNLQSGAPRFDHDPVTGESLGLLIEESRTNLIYPSIPVINSSAITVTPNAAVAPDNTTTATFCEPDNAGSGIRSNASIAKTAGETYTHTFYYKPSGYNVAGIDYGSGNPDSYAEGWIDVTTNLSYLKLPTSNSSGFSDIQSTPVANGWYKITLIQEIAVSGTSASWGKLLSCRPNVPTASNQSYTRVSGAGGYFWGSQEELGSFPTSYIPTSGSTVTRAADIASIEGTNFSFWYNDSASTLYIESPGFPEYGKVYNGAFIYISDAAVFNLGTGDGIKFGTGSPNSYNRLFVTEGATNVSPFNESPGTKFAFGLTAGDLASAIDGSIVGTNNTVVMPTGMDRLVMTPYGPGYAHISRLTYYPYRLPDATLQEITS